MSDLIGIEAEEVRENFQNALYLAGPFVPNGGLRLIFGLEPRTFSVII